MALNFIYFLIKKTSFVMISRKIFYIIALILVLPCFDSSSIDSKNKRSVFNYFRSKIINNEPFRPKPVHSVAESNSENDENLSSNSDHPDIQ